MTSISHRQAGQSFLYRTQHGNWCLGEIVPSLDGCRTVSYKPISGIRMGLDGIQVGWSIENLSVLKSLRMDVAPWRYKWDWTDGMDLLQCKTLPIGNNFLAINDFSWRSLFLLEIESNKRDNAGWDRVRSLCEKRWSGRWKVSKKHSLILSGEALILTLSILPCLEGWISWSIPAD